ncbi:MAG: ferrous iron transport protein A [Acutalibacteraceae bacterium]
MSLVSLNTLSVGEHAYVRKIDFGSSDRRRMQDIGLISGTRVECLGKAISGDPAAYLIRGAVIALRTEDAARIAVAKA